MKDNYVIGIAIVIGVLFFGGLFFLVDKSPNLGSYGDPNTYLIVAPTRATTTVSTTKSNGNPSTIVSENTARVNLTITPNQSIFIWLTNSTTTSMTNIVANANASGSDGIFIAADATWNMQDYGIIWPGIVYGMASTTEATVRYVDFTRN